MDNAKDGFVYTQRAVEHTQIIGDKMNAQETVNYLERVSLSNGDDLIIYEEGLYDDTGANLIATKLYHRDIGFDVVREHNMPPLFGNVIYLEGGLK